VPATIGVGLGLIHGTLNGRSIEATQTSFVTAIGIAAAVALLSIWLSAGSAVLNRPWQRIAIRTLGSWIAAFGLLSLAWAFRPAEVATARLPDLDTPIADVACSWSHESIRSPVRR